MYMGNFPENNFRIELGIHPFDDGALFIGRGAQGTLVLLSVSQELES